MGTAFEEAVMAPPVPGVQKPPHRVRKRFQDRRVVASMKEKVKKPAGLKTRHVGKFGKGWQSPKVCWALVPRRIKLEGKRMDELTKCGKFETKNQLQAGMRHSQKYQSNRVKNCAKNNDKYEQRRTQSTAEGRHWSFPSCSSFRCTNCLTKQIFAK
jgi:hypothetical protein